MTVPASRQGCCATEVTPLEDGRLERSLQFARYTTLMLPTTSGVLKGTASPCKTMRVPFSHFNSLTCPSKTAIWSRSSLNELEALVSNPQLASRVVAPH